MGQATGGRAIGGAASTCWEKVLISFRRCRTTNAGSQVLSYLFGPKPSRSFSLWLSPSLPLRTLSRHQSLDIGDQVNSPHRHHYLPSSGRRVEAEAATKRQISGRWPASDSFAKTVLSPILSHGPRCPEYLPPRTLHCCWPRISNSVTFSSTAE